MNTPLRPAPPQPSSPSLPPSPSSPPALAPPATHPPVRRWAVRGVLFSLWAYLVTLGMLAIAKAYFPRGSSTRTLLVFLPFLTLLLLVCVIYWVHQAHDEYLRRRIQRSIVITAILVTFATLGYFCLETLGYPRRSMITVNIFGWTIFSIQLLFIIRRRR